MAQAKQKAPVVVTLKAAGDLSSSQFKFVKISADNTVDDIAAATDVPYGVLLNKPDAANKDASVQIGGVAKVQSDASLSAGNLVGTSADGQADAKTVGTDTTEYVRGIVEVAGGAAGEMSQILLIGPFRAA